LDSDGANNLRRRLAKGLERVDSRSRYGRLMKALDQHGPLLRVGTTGVDLLELLAEINDTEHIALKGEGRRLVRHTREYLEAGFPVVLGFH
ncbi:hydrophobic compound transporter HcuA, partial [Klebsiella pneumoniae]